MNYVVPVEDRTPEAMRTMHHGDWEECEGCHEILIWDNIPDEDVKVEYQKSEFWGAPAYEPIVVGFTCPKCGQYNSM